MTRLLLVAILLMLIAWAFWKVVDGIIEAGDTQMKMLGDLGRLLRDEQQPITLVYLPRSTCTLAGNIFAGTPTTETMRYVPSVAQLATWDGTPHQCCEVRSQSRDVKAALSDDARRFVVFGEGFASLWSDEGTLLGDLVGPDSPDLSGTRGKFRGVCFGPDGRVATAAAHGPEPEADMAPLATLPRDA